MMAGNLSIEQRNCILYTYLWPTLYIYIYLIASMCCLTAVSPLLCVTRHSKSATKFSFDFPLAEVACVGKLSALLRGRDFLRVQG
jgi:hypothetical protein